MSKLKLKVSVNPTEKLSKVSKIVLENGTVIELGDLKVEGFKMVAKLGTERHEIISDGFNQTTIISNSKNACVGTVFSGTSNVRIGDG